jgi:hypothetical protein
LQGPIRRAPHRARRDFRDNGDVAPQPKRPVEAWQAIELNPPRGPRPAQGGSHSTIKTASPKRTPPAAEDRWTPPKSSFGDARLHAVLLSPSDCSFRRAPKRHPSSRSRPALRRF